MKSAQLIGLVVVLIAVGAVVALKSNNAQQAPEPASTVQTNLPRLLDLGSTTCASCKRMAPIIEELSAELQGSVKVEFIDVATKVEAADQYGIRTIPTQIFFDASGKEVARHEGFMPKEDILAQLEKMGVAVK